MASVFSSTQKTARHYWNLYSHYDKEAFLGAVLIFSQSNQYFIKEIEMVYSRPEKKKKPEEEEDSKMKGRV